MSDERRGELARFLRSRREQMTPERAGLPTTSRRRTHGLRREEVAVLAGVSPTWYTYLEQGRDIRPSAEVLDSLSRVLALDEDERRYVHRLSGGQPPPGPAPDHGDAENAELLTEVVRAWGREDMPVYAANQYTDMIAWNDATSEWYADFGNVPVDDRNMMRWMFTSPVARERFVDWEDEARNLVARLRAAYAARSWDVRYGLFIRALTEDSPEFRAMWRELNVREQHVRPRRINVPGRGTVTVKVAVLRLAEDPFHSIILHLPVTRSPDGDEG